jgi:2-phosphoglycerate kinase
MGLPVSPFQKGMISRSLDATSLRPEYAPVCAIQPVRQSESGMEVRTIQSDITSTRAKK